MNIFIIGMNLTSLILSKALVNIGCIVHVLPYSKKLSNFSTRTIGISKSNLNFINKNIISLSTKKFHSIKKISIFSEKKEEIIKFYNNGENLFSLVEVNRLYDTLYNNLKLNKNFKIKKFKSKNFKNNYNLIINCEKNNFISRKYFSKNFKKSYNSTAYTSIIHHQKIKNIEAKQFFTDFGPLAFLPLSPKITSVVFSAYNSGESNDQNFKKFVINFSNDLNIKKFSRIQKAKLYFSLARKYYFENILLFGDGLHQIHPLAGQGFNMTIRDLKILINIIKNRIDYGLEIDSSCLKDFEQLTRNKNFIFSEGINFIQDLFRIKKYLGKNRLNNIIKKIGKNKKINSFFIKTADEGISTFNY